uniref:Gustatory receptor n=1 Tax=Anopheles farauti TaxID=69004 RepID=A0A182QNK3_9DIPT
MADTVAEKRRIRWHLYRTFKPYLTCAQLLCTAPPCCAGWLLEQWSLGSYFKQARLLLTASILTSVVICGARAIVQLVELPMPFFTSVLYVNEVVLGVVICFMAVNRGFSERVRCQDIVDAILTVASAIPYTDWTDSLRYARLRLQGICATFVIVCAVALLCDYLHFGSVYATLFTLCAYLLPNVLAGVSIVQYCVGNLLVYKLQQNINRRLSSADIILEEHLGETKHLYLQLAYCATVLTRSYEVLILTNVFAGINVTSLQLLEIYQYLQQTETNAIYVAYNVLWIFLQLYMLLIVIYPNDMLKREIFIALLSFMIILIQFDSSNLNKHNGEVTAIDSLYNAHS